MSIQCCEQPTNGVTYFRAISDISQLPQDLKPYVPLFCEIVTGFVSALNDFRHAQHSMNS